MSRTISFFAFLSVFSFNSAVFVLGATDGTSDAQVFGEFESPRLKYELLKPHHLSSVEEMFSALDLFVLMNRAGLTAGMLTAAFKVHVDRVKDEVAGGTFDITTTNPVLYAITQRIDDDKFRAGDFIGSASLQNLSAESVAAKDKMFSELKEKYGNLYIVGLSFRKEAQGLGYAREVCNFFTDHFLRMTKDMAVALVSSGFKGNTPSVKTLEGCGLLSFSKKKRRRERIFQYRSLPENQIANF